MRPSPIAKLLRLLERGAGGKVSYLQLKHEVLRESARPASRRPQRSPHRSRRIVVLTEHKIEALIKELTELKLIQQKGKYLFPKKPFHLSGKLSLNQRGAGFAAVTGAAKAVPEVFFQPRDTQGAFTRDQILFRLRDHHRGRFEGSVLRVIERGRSSYRILLLAAPEKRARTVMGLILDMQPVRLFASLSLKEIPSLPFSQLKKDSVAIVSLGEEQVYSRFVDDYAYEASFIGLEEGADSDKDLKRILLKYNLSKTFPTSCKETKEYTEPQKENTSDWKKRNDLRQLYTITIDGENAKDFDDALSLQILSPNRVRLYVHISDVSFYVPFGSELDKEALKRGTSCYLADNVIPMLPFALSNELCSLKAGQNRLALTAEIEVDWENGKIINTKFYRSIIRVDRRFTYTKAEESLNHPQADSLAAKLQELSEKEKYFETAFLAALWKLAKAQRQRRKASGRIDLNLPEPAFHFGSSEQIKSITYKERLKSSILIEECMLSANTGAAAFLQKKKIPGLYRNHEPIEAGKLEVLNSFCSSSNLPVVLKDNSCTAVSAALDTVNAHLGPKNLPRLFQIMLLRSFAKAFYGPASLGHWGLGFSSYCHFTSPIRRYPDLIIHRLLLSAIEKTKPLYNFTALEEIGIKTSETERIAVDAERDISKIKIMRYLMESRLQNFTGYITGIRPERIFLELSKLPLEVIVESARLTDGQLSIDDPPFSVFIKKLGRKAHLGEEWDLRLLSIDTEDMQVLCRPVFSK